MRFTTSFILAAMPYLISAAPIRRAASAAATADTTVFGFADVLEAAEATFYSQALSKFQSADFVAAGVTSPEAAVQQLQIIQADEAAHKALLDSALAALGAMPLQCDFNFAPALVDLPTTIATARKVEYIGIAAYLGAAPLLTVDPVALVDAGSILAVEAMHETILNMMNEATPIPNPQIIPFQPNEVLAMVSPFISGCNVGIPSNPTLTVTNTGTIKSGTTLTFSSSAITGDTSGFSCHLLVANNPLSMVMPFNQCIVPSGLDGPVAVIITNDTQPLTTNSVTRSASGLVAGPDLFFVDNTESLISQLVRNSPGAAPPSGAVAAPPPASDPSAAAPLPPATAPVDAAPAPPSTGSTAPPAPVDAAPAPLSVDPSAPAAPETNASTVAAPVTAPGTNASTVAAPVAAPGTNASTVATPPPPPSSGMTTNGISLFDGNAVVMGASSVPAAGFQPSTSR